MYFINIKFPFFFLQVEHRKEKVSDKTKNWYLLPPMAHLNKYLLTLLNCVMMRM